MERVTISAEAARSALASDVVTIDGWNFINGLQPTDLDNDRAPLPEYIEEQTRKVLANLDRILESLGASRDDVVSVRVSLVQLERFLERMDKVYAGFFSEGGLPARSCVGVTDLTRGALVEMDFVVRAKGRKT